jgi:large subunit GTPase 1
MISCGYDIIAFLDWRRALADMEEKAFGEKEITPFEKNIEIWRQLWRVVERSDVIVQIVDARNPLLFRCPDLDQYVKEVDTRKRCVLMINKADYLSRHARKEWVKYLKSQGN